MTRSLRYYPDPVLTEPCEPVEDPAAHDDLVEAMVNVLYGEDGVGLAAPQVGVSRQLFLLCLDPEKQWHEVYINPSIHEVEDERPVEEGCLSFPDVTVEVERGSQVSFSAVTPSGREIQRTVEGLQAHCVQHEVDHLRGRTLIDYCDLQEKMALDETLRQRDDASP